MAYEIRVSDPSENGMSEIIICESYRVKKAPDVGVLQLITYEKPDFAGKETTIYPSQHDRVVCKEL